MSVVRIRRSVVDKDEYGDDVYDAGTRKTLEGAFTAPRMSEALDDNARSGVVVGLTLFAPYNTDLVHTDLVEVDGELYVLDGEPGKWRHPRTSWEAGITVALVRGEG